MSACVKGMEMVLGVILVSVLEVVQMSGEVGGVVRRWGVGVRGCMQTCGPGRLAALTVSEDGRLHPGP